MNPIKELNVAEVQLRIIAKISLVLAGLTTIALVVTSRMFGPIPDAEYAATVGHLADLKARLEQLMLVGALTLIALTAITTWLIALYSSFRVAGPLFRLARNLELLIADRQAVLLPLRQGDRLHQEALNLEQARQALAAHYAELASRVDCCRQFQYDTANPSAIQAQIAELRGYVDHARL